MKTAGPNNHHCYNKKLRRFARNLRKRMTKAEACLWKYALKNRLMAGYQFRRQRPILNCIADFVCLELKLVIEVDGSMHELEHVQARDLQKENDLKAAGFHVLRFSNWEVLHDMDGVKERLYGWIKRNALVPPPGPRQRRRWRHRKS